MSRSPKPHPRTKRDGVAAIWALVVLAVLTTMIGAVTWQTVAGFRQSDRRHAQLQALWLARAGVELAAARWLDGSKDYTGETVELIPHGSVRIQVKKDPKTPDAISVVSEGRYAADERRPVIRVETRIIRRAKGKETRIEMVPKDS